jgi:TetR/AcrR family transcriptional regulator, fatty acid metabolism regulator protein
MKTETIKKKEKEKGEKLHAILEAAELVMSDEGLQAFSISKIAKKAKIAKGTVYLYFDSKEEIIGSLTIKARKKLLEYFHEYCEKQSDPLDKIRAIFWADYDFFKERNLYHQLVSFYEQHTGLTEDGELAKTSYDISSYITNLIENAKNKGAIRDDLDSATTTFMFWGMVVGMLQLIETKQQQIGQYLQKDEKQLYEQFVEHTINGLK